MWKYMYFKKKKKKGVNNVIINTNKINTYEEKVDIFEI